MEFNLIPDFNSGALYSRKLSSEILKTNDISINYGLELKESDVAMLVQASKDSIIDNDRIEFGESATIKIINKFMQSSYVSQSCYAETIASLIDVFYEVKEESLDVLTDYEVIDMMFNFFENESGGSIDVLQNRDMDTLCRKIRYTAMGIKDDDMEQE